MTQLPQAITTAIALLTLASCGGLRKPSVGVPSEHHFRLMTAVENYQLPSLSFPPSRHADPQIYQTTLGMRAVADSQGLIFDGRRASEGIVIVGRPGSTAPILLALSVYVADGRVATQDLIHYRASDTREALAMKSQFMRATH